MSVAPPPPGSSTVLDALADAIEAAAALGLETDPARAVLDEGRARLGLVPDAYVLALVGGTGVGKSTLLNALAGEVVSPAGVRRPTTDRPVAWLTRGSPGLIAPLLRHLEVEVELGTAGHDGDESGRAAAVVLDLPDVDSVDASHRAAVEAVLPKVDVVAWVLDPEKYADAVLHDSFLRAWLGRLERQIVLLNKVDRLAPADIPTVVADLEAVLRREVPPLVGHPPRVVTTSAVAGEEGIADLRGWLREASDAKAVAAGRVSVAARAAIAELARAAGVDDGADREPLLGPEDRRRAASDAVLDVLAVVDLPGVERRAIAATRAMARRSGTGPMGLLTSAIYRATGRQAQAANPRRYLAEWRGRGVLARATERLRQAVADALPRVPPKLRHGYAAATEGPETERRLNAAVEAALARVPDSEPPTSRLWPVIGLLQSANTVLLVFAAAWVVVWILARPPVATYDLPVLGPVPAPLLLLAVGLLIGYLAARALGVHAGWLGRRWARRLGSEIRSSVADAVEREAFRGFDRLEAARTDLTRAWDRVR